LVIAHDKRWPPEMGSDFGRVPDFSASPGKQIFSLSFYKSFYK
jgi:hypothetical protein